MKVLNVRRSKRQPRALGGSLAEGSFEKSSILSSE